jgi:hypothetical protein
VFCKKQKEKKKKKQMPNDVAPSWGVCLQRNEEKK